MSIRITIGVESDEIGSVTVSQTSLVRMGMTEHQVLALALGHAVRAVCRTYGIENIA